MPVSLRRAALCLLIATPFSTTFADDADYDPRWDWQGPNWDWQDPRTPQNSAPVISGSPPATALAGRQYVFTPTVSDADGDALTFTATNLPPWLRLNSATGMLSGIPFSYQAGEYGGIVLVVSDGRATASLGPFSITVPGAAPGANTGGGIAPAPPATTGSVTLNWQPPTAREDGSPLFNLAGYRVYAGTSPQVMTLRAVISNPGLTSYVVENLSPGTWWFTMTAYDSAGLESDRAAPVVRSVR